MASAPAPPRRARRPGHAAGDGARAARAVAASLLACALSGAHAASGALGSLTFGSACTPNSILQGGLCCCPSTGLVAYGQQDGGEGTVSNCVDAISCSSRHSGFCTQSLPNGIDGAAGSGPAPMWELASKGFCQRACPCCVEFPPGDEAPAEGRRLRAADAVLRRAPPERPPRRTASGVSCGSVDRSQCPVCKCCPLPNPWPEAGQQVPPMPGNASVGALGGGGAPSSDPFVLGQGLLEALGQRAEQVAPNMTAKHIILMLNASAKLGWMPQPSLLNALRKRAEVVVPQMTAQNIASILTAYARIGKDPGDQLLHALMSRAELLAGRMSPEQVANSLHALAVMGQDPGGPLMLALGDRVLAVAASLTSVDVANVLDAFANMRTLPAEKVRDAVSSRAESLAPMMDPHNVSSVVHAYAVFGRLGLGAPSEALLGALLTRAEATAKDMDPGDIARLLEGYTLLWEQLEGVVIDTVHGKADMQADHGANVLVGYNTMWKLSQMKRLGLSLLEAIGQRAETLAPNMDPEGVAVTLNAYSKVGAEMSPVLTTKLAARIKEVASDMPAWSVATTLDTYPDLHSDPKLVQALESRAVRVVLAMTGSDVAHMLHAYSKSQLRPDDRLLSLLGARALHEAPKLAAMEAATILDACASVWLQPNEPLVDALEQRIEEVAGDMNANDVARVYVAFAKLRGHIQTPLLMALMDQALQVVPSMSASDVAAVLSAHAALGALPGQSLLAALAQRANEAAPTMTAQDVANVMSAYSRLWQEHARLQMQSVQTMPEEGSSNAKLVLAVMQEMGHTLMKTLGARAEEVAPKMTASDVAAVLDAFASIGEQPAEPLLVSLGHRAQEVVDTMSAQDVAKTLSAYAALRSMQKDSAALAS